MWLKRKTVHQGWNTNDQWKKFSSNWKIQMKTIVLSKCKAIVSVFVCFVHLIKSVKEAPLLYYFTEKETGLE